jgi:hypothetical protein
LKKYLLYNKKLGYYQGSFMQMAFWSNLEYISDYAVVFNNIKDAENYIMANLYEELLPYGDYYGKPFDFKIHEINGCNSNYIRLKQV